MRWTTIDDPNRVIRIIQVGAGGMGKAWLRALRDAPEVELIGLVDLDLAGAKAAAREAGFSNVPCARSITELFVSTAPDAVLNVTVPAAHYSVDREAMLLGLPVLSEKPAAPTVAEAFSLAAISEATGQLLMISQSRRYYRTLAAYKAALTRLGHIGILTHQFFRAPHFGGFREEMASPLLVDMSIHAFDVARYLLDEDPISVYADSFNPSWSWFSGDAAAAVIFEFASGTRFVYQGSWVSRSLETSWNGEWRASSEQGTALWDGENMPSLSIAAEVVDLGETGDDRELREEIAGSLSEFVGALRSGVEPSGEIHRNIPSLAMVEAAVLSASRGERVAMAEVLDAAGQ
ncbi:MAG: Gfo/Idh/MocA family protein [Leifsonia sp.]